MQPTLPASSQSTNQANQAATFISEADVAGMFAKWKAYFKTKMKDEEWALTTILIWQAVLNEHNITHSELEAGTMKACLDLSLDGWPPTTATDFIKIVRGPLSNEYPDAQTAFETACRCAGMRGEVERNWGHAVVLETANRIGWGRLASADNRFLSYFKPVYEKVLAEHRAGASFVVKKENRLAAPKPINIDEHEQLSETWAQIRARLGVKKRASNA